MSPDYDLERLKELLTQAEALDLEDREEFLRRAAGDSPPLSRELRSLLAAGEGEDDPFLFSAATPLSIADGENGSVPKRIGPYAVEGVLGRGGMGIVYRARNPEVGLPVALKVLRPGLDSQEFLRRFELERAVLTRLQHRNIARIYDAGVDPFGPPYLAMELVDGPDLLTACNARHASLRERLELFREVCLGVHHAHLRGVLHRDLKPSNVLVVEENARPVPKIIDFGIAKALGEGPGDGVTGLTAQGQALGTLEYMSPEQADPEVADVDVRADIYSLGVLLYELLTGELPFDEKRYRHRHFAAVLSMLQDESPPSPADRLRSGEGREPIPADLGCVVLKCLEGDRELRYGSAQELADDLERFLGGELVLAKVPSRTYLARKFIRRNRALFATLLSVFLALALGLVGTSFGFYRAWQHEQELERNVEDLRQALDDRERALDEGELISTYLYTVLRWGRPGQMGPKTTLAEATMRLAEHVRESEDHPDSVRGRGLIAAGLGMSHLEDQEGAMAALEEGIATIGIPETERGRQLVALAYADLGNLQRAKGDLAAAEKSYQEGLEFLDEGSDPELATALEMSLATALGTRGDHWTVAQLMGQVLERLESTGAGGANLARTYKNRGLGLFYAGDRDRGYELVNRGVELGREVFEPTDRALLLLVRAHGEMLLDDFRAQEAREVLEDLAVRSEANWEADTFRVLYARALLLLARLQEGWDDARARELEALRDRLEEEYPQQTASAALRRRHIAVEILHARPGALDRGRVRLAELPRTSNYLPGLALIAELFGRAAHRASGAASIDEAESSASESTVSESTVAAREFLGEALELHRQFVHPDAPIFAELERLLAELDGAG